MRKLFFLLAAMSLVACSPKSAAETFTQSRTIEDGGSGPYTALMVEEPGLEAHTLFRPKDLSPFGGKKLLPILVWGNGACANSPFEHVNFLNEIASHGFLVVATGYFPADNGRYSGPSSTSAQQIESIDWVYAVNEDKTSPYYHLLDVKNIALAGMSCGGLQTLDNAAEPRVKTLMICNSGLFANASGAMPGMPMPAKERLNEIHTPIIYILGGPEDIAYGNGMDDVERINHVPLFAANYPVGHGGTYARPHGGEFAVVATAWLKWQLQDDQEAATFFIGDPCGLQSRADWTVTKKNIP